MISTQSTATKKVFGPPEARDLLAKTAHHVKIMKASWVHVAMNLKVIRDNELWRHSTQSCENFEDYMFGVLKLNRAVARRMLQALDYTTERRPSFAEAFHERGETMDVPSYDTVNQLRTAESRFEGREEEFHELEAKVFDEGVGRVTLKREIDSRLSQPAPAAAPAAATAVDAPEESPSLENVILELRKLERELLRLEVPREARKLMFRLVEFLSKEAGAST